MRDAVAMPGGIGLSDFMANFAAGSNNGLAALQQGFGALSQMQQQRRLHDQAQQDQLAAEQRQHDWELQQQAHADAVRRQGEDLTAAEHGLMRVPNGDQAAAQHVVEAPAQARAAPVAANANVASMLGLPGLPGYMATGTGGPGAQQGWLESSQRAAALADPNNARALARAGGPDQAMTSGWEKLRDVAFNGGGDTWRLDPGIPPRPVKAGNQKGAYDWEGHYDEQARANIANEQPPPPLMALLQAAQQSAAQGVPLSTAQQQQLDGMNAKWEADKESRRAANFKAFITRDAQAGIPEAVDLAGRYGFIDRSKAINPHNAPAGLPAGGAPFNMEADANVPDVASAPDEGLDSEEQAIQARLAGMGSAKSGAAVAGRAPPSAQAGPAAPLYPVDLLAGLTRNNQPGLPNVAGLAAAQAQPGQDQPGQPLTQEQVLGQLKSSFAQPPYTPGGMEMGFNPNKRNLEDVQPLIDFLRHRQAPTAATPVVPPQTPMVPPQTPMAQPTGQPQSQLAQQWQAATGSAFPQPGTDGAPDFDSSILGLGLNPDQAKAAGITVGPNGSFSMDPQRPGTGIFDRALATVHGLFGSGAAAAATPLADQGPTAIIPPPHLTPAGTPPASLAGAAEAKQMNDVVGGATAEAKRRMPGTFKANAPDNLPYKFVGGTMVAKVKGEHGYRPGYKVGDWPFQ